MGIVDLGRIGRDSMSLNSGLEALAGIGNTQANSLFDANMQRLDVFARDLVAFRSIGEAQAGGVFFYTVFPYDAYIEKIIFNAHYGPPTGADLIVKVKVAGAAAAKDFTLPANAVAATDTPATPTTILATAGQIVELYFSQVGSVNRGNEINGFIQICKRKV
jgi:hypothetical protein